MICKVIKGKKKSDYTFVFCNGFASDFSYWNNLINLFSDYDCILISEDYFCDKEHQISNEEFKQIFSKKKNLIGIGHSLGYSKLCELHLRHDFFKLKKIVAVEGFSSFLGSFLVTKMIRKFSLDYMIILYNINLFNTLYAFQIFCGAWPIRMPKKIDKELFMKDLDLLNYASDQIKVPHLVLTSVDDPVIPYYIIEDNFRKTPDSEILYTFGCQHVLGMKDTKFVFENIIKFAQK